MSPAERPILLPLRSLPGSLFSFEALLVLYIFAGSYKADPRFAWIPVDLTGLFFALSVAVGGIIIVRKGMARKGLPVVFAMACLVAWLGVSLLWSPSEIYGPHKVLLMATLVLWALIAGALIIAPDPERLRRLFTLLLLFAIWVGIEAVLVYEQAGGAIERIKNLESSGYLLAGRICGLGALIVLVGWLYSRGRAARRLCLVLFLALAFVLAIAGGRGPLVSTALPLLIPVWLSFRVRMHSILFSRALLWLLVLLPALPVGLALYATITEQRVGTIERLERLLAGDLSGSAANRVELYENAFEFWPRAPVLGNGAGSWPILERIPDRESYPHNLFLEVLVEAGLIGLILFLALLAVALRPVSFERLRRDPQALCAVMLFASTLLNAMTSADLPGNRAVFLMLGVLALFAIRSVGAVAPAGAPRQPAAPLDLSIARRRHASAEHIR